MGEATFSLSLLSSLFLCVYLLLPRRFCLPGSAPSKLSGPVARRSCLPPEEEETFPARPLCPPLRFVPPPAAGRPDGDSQQCGARRPWPRHSAVTLPLKCAPSEDAPQGARAGDVGRWVCGALSSTAGGGVAWLLVSRATQTLVLLVLPLA